MALTDAKVRNLKGKKKPYKVSDGEGLYVLVPPNGSKLFRVSYRYLGKQKTLVIGRYPTVSLLNARRARDDAKRLLSKGTDPSRLRAAEKRERILAADNTFASVADEWFEINKAKWVPTNASRIQSRMKADLFPALGRLPLADIEPIQILDAIRAIERRGALEMAKRVMQIASAVFKYGVATSRCRRDPTNDLKGALRPSPPPKRRTALPGTELMRFMQDLEQYDGDITTKLALKLIVLTFVRTAELRFAKWTEFEGLDEKEPLWRIPADRMKMRRPHLVPLAPQAVEAIRKLRKLTGNAEYLFPAATKSGVMSENTLIFALYRMGYHSRATVHGFRATASTVLNEAQYNRDYIEMQLAHFDGSVRGVYNAAEWLPGRREMMCWWANRLDVKTKIALVA